MIVHDTAITNLQLVILMSTVLSMLDDVHIVTPYACPPLATL